MMVLARPTPRKVVKSDSMTLSHQFVMTTKHSKMVARDNREVIDDN